MRLPRAVAESLGPSIRLPFRELIAAIAAGTADVDLGPTFRTALVPGFDFFRGHRLFWRCFGVSFGFHLFHALFIRAFLGTLRMNPRAGISGLPADGAQGARFGRVERYGSFGMHWRV